MPRLLNKDTSPFHLPSVTMADGKRAPIVVLLPKAPVEVSVAHAQALYKHAIVGDRMRRGLIVNADREDERDSDRSGEPSPADAMLEQARARVRELEASLSAATAASPKSVTEAKNEAKKRIAEIESEAKKRIADLEADVADLMKDSDAKTVRIRELESQLAAAKVPPAIETKG